VLVWSGTWADSECLFGEFIGVFIGAALSLIWSCSLAKSVFILNWPTSGILSPGRKGALRA